MTEMSRGSVPGQYGILWCSQDFDNAYCIRKVIELVSSSIILLSAVSALITIIKRQKARQYFWLVLIIAIMVCYLIANIIFCFLNEEYWLYAIETYFYNLYYLFLVGYVTKSYLLKYRQIINLKRFLLDPQNETKKRKERTIFYAIFIGIGILYTIILIVSVIVQVKEMENESKLQHCQQIWYLCFEGGCILLSIIVLLALHRNQIEESAKVESFSKQYQKREGGCWLTKSSNKESNETSSKEMINNPLKTLWVWISLNVASQLFDLVQSVLYSMASPPECLIIVDRYIISNILELIFVYLSTYLCFMATLFYVLKKSSAWHKHMVNKETFLENNTENTPNIELYYSNPQPQNPVIL